MPAGIVRGGGEICFRHFQLRTDGLRIKRVLIEREAEETATS